MTWIQRGVNVIVPAGIALLGTASKVVPISEDRRRKSQVKHNLGRRLYGSQGQHKIGDAHLGHA